MPPKKNNLIYKQKRVIATRLMQISLLVDDYVYQEKPMSQRSAEAYIREISAYKDKCYQDERSLQVIEKLIRCMKGIINEQEELRNVSAVEDDKAFIFQNFSGNDNAMLSPVYSTPDEDLTQIPQYIEVEDHTVNYEKHDNAKDLNRAVIEDFNNETQTGDVNADKNSQSAIETMEIYPKNNITNVFKYQPKIKAADYSLDNIEVIDLCDDEIDERQNSHSLFLEPEFNIQNAISSLSIRDIEEAFTTPLSQEYQSQSILDNFCPNNAYTQLKDVVVTLTQNNDDVLKTATVTHQKPEKIESLNDNLTKIVLPITNKKINVQLPLNSKPVFCQNINTEKMQDKYKQTRNAKSSKIIIKKPLNAKNKNNILSDSSETVTKINVSKTETNKKSTANSTKIKRQAQKQRNKKAYQNKNKPQDEVHKPTKLSMQSQNNTIQTTKIAKPLTPPKIQPLTKQTTDKKHTKIHNKCKDAVAPIPNIYNTTMLNDLSWIENIRLVRETQSEEYESLSVNEVFWENYTLPGNWDDKDFNY